MRRGQGVKGAGWGLGNALMRVEGVGELEGLLPWTPAGASSWSWSFVIMKKKKAKERFECERTSEKRDKKRGKKSWDLTA